MTGTARRRRRRSCPHRRRRFLSLAVYSPTTRVSLVPRSFRIIEILERKKRKERRWWRVRREREKKRRLPRRIALLMEPWLSVGPSYNVHYIYLPGSVVLPECRPEGPPPAEHKAVKRFNSIRAAERRVGSTAASSNLTPPLVLRFGNRRRGLPCLSVLTHRVLFAFVPPFPPNSTGSPSIALDNVSSRRGVHSNLP